MTKVQDTSDSDSTIFRVDLLVPVTGNVINVVAYLGSCEDCDIVETLALDPGTGQLYGISGGGNNRTTFPEKGDFFKIDKDTGDLMLVGNTGTGLNGEIVSASFRPPPFVAPCTLWAFQEGVGLLTIDVDNGDITEAFSVTNQNDQNVDPIGDNWEGLAWDLAGRFLYGSDLATLYRFDPTTTMVDLVCNNLGNQGDYIESLEFRPDGTLIGG